MNLFESIENLMYDELYFQKWNFSEKRDKKKRTKARRRGTNFKQLKAKKGYKRIKLSGTNRYVRVPMTANEKMKRKVVGRKLGNSPL